MVVKEIVGRGGGVRGVEGESWVEGVEFERGRGVEGWRGNRE